MVWSPFIAILVLAAVAAILFEIGRRLGRLGTQVQILTGLGALAVYAVNQWLLVTPSLHTRLFPWPGYIYYSNWSLPCAGLLAGAAMATSLSVRRRVTRGILVAGMLVCALVLSWTVTFPDYPATDVNDFQGLICQQSDDDSCGPAAIATYLNLLGYRTTESQATYAAMTRERLGTSSLGLWHGLASFERDVAPDAKARVGHFDMNSITNLKTPMVIRVQLRSDAPQIVQDYLSSEWPPGLSHAVVLLGRDPRGRYIVAEPFDGVFESWSATVLSALWDGSAYYLEKNSEPLSAGVVLARAG